MKISKRMEGIVFKKDSAVALDTDGIIGGCTLSISIRGVCKDLKLTIKKNDTVEYYAVVTGNGYKVSIPLVLSFGEDISIACGEDRVGDLVIFNL